MELEYLDKVAKICEVKYELDREVVESVINHIEQCYEQNYTPRRTVEVVASLIFGI
jgi:hypothetical protein